ncbi:MAG TPA: sirohydrochlorin chelatase [Aliidongia sp.]|uniref:sirohydrochlorin chelatase n=1 Tax=Aliidongia sp. TaxID=1914230 RepID=UPI002DDCD68D|nr:sirohydrochlorin chelatase [Aliidongia sp.]HEV2674475.1 sirohydrochlorin chelatase [Aliidongia sp.]
MTSDGFLLCGHGSRDPVSVAGFARIARGLAPLLPGRPFAHGFMELAEPDLDTAIGGLVRDGVGRILAVPGFLFAARHMREDLPRELAAASARHGVEVVLGRELGADPRLVEALGDRLSALIPAQAGIQDPRDPDVALESRGRGNDGEGMALVLVGAGSSDPDTNAGLCGLCDELGRIHGLAAIACYASVATPTVAQAIETMLDQGHRRILLLPWFLTEGSLLGLARTQARAAVGDRAVLLEAAALGPHPRVLATLADRAKELAR